MSDSLVSASPGPPARAHAETEEGLASFLATACIYTTFFAAYIGSSLPGYGFGALLILLRLHRLRLTGLEVAAIGFLTLYTFWVLYMAEYPVVVLMNLRHWFGGVFFAIFFLVCRDVRLGTSRFFYLVCATVILEAIAINMGVSPESLPNYHFEGEGGNFAGYGGYARPLSFTGSPTMSAGALIVLYYLQAKANPHRKGIRDLALLTTCILLFSSGTGFILLLLLLLLEAIEARLFSLHSLVFAVVLTTFGILLANVDFETFRYLSLQYYQFIVEMKVGLLTDFLSESTSRDVLLLGTQLHDAIPITAGDFGWYHLLSACGLAGTLLFFFIVVAFLAPGANRLVPLLLMFVGTIHYPAAMSQAGQLLFGFTLVSRAKCFRRRTSP